MTTMSTLTPRERIGLRLYALGWTVQRWRLHAAAEWRSLRADLAAIIAARRQAVRERNPQIMRDCRAMLRAGLPSRPEEARPASAKAGPDEAAPPVAAGGTAPDPPVQGAVPLPRSVRYPALNPRLYETGEMPGISQETADEAWWML